MDSPVMEKNMKAVADYINTMTGASNLGRLEHTKAFSNYMYSMRMLYSKIKLSMGVLYYAKMPKYARRVAMKETANSLAGMMITTSAIIGGVLANANLNPDNEADDEEFKQRTDYETGLLVGNSQANINLNVQSTDFMKVRIGNKTYGWLGGFEQPVKALSQVISGYKYNNKGFQTKLNAAGFGDTGLDVVVNFFLNKTAPLTSLAIKKLDRRENEKPKSKAETAISLYSPFPAQTMRDIYLDEQKQKEEAKINGGTYESNILNQFLMYVTDLTAASVGLQVNVDKEFEKYTSEEMKEIKNQQKENGTYIPTIKEQEGGGSSRRQMKKRPRRQLRRLQ